MSNTRIFVSQFDNMKQFLLRHGNKFTPISYLILSIIYSQTGRLFYLKPDPFNSIWKLEVSSLLSYLVFKKKQNIDIYYNFYNNSNSNGVLAKPSTRFLYHCSQQQTIFLSDFEFQSFFPQTTWFVFPSILTKFNIWQNNYVQLIYIITTFHSTVVFGE